MKGACFHFLMSVAAMNGTAAACVAREDQHKPREVPNNAGTVLPTSQIMAVAHCPPPTSCCILSTSYTTLLR